jgi:endoglucanase
MNINDMRHISSFDLIKEMKIGWSLGNTFDAWDAQAGFTSHVNETSWGNPMTTKAMFDEIKAKGFNVIRIGVTWYGHFDEVTYEIDPAWFDRVEQVIHYALDGGETFVVINTHHETAWATTTDSNLLNAITILEALWTQIANRFKNYNEYLIFTGLGEPRMVNHPDQWVGNPEGFGVVNILNGVFINAVKSTGGNNFHRTLLIPTYAASGTLAAIQALADGFQTGMIPNSNNVAVTVDCYIPNDFALYMTGIPNWSRLNPSDTLPIDTLMSNLNDYFISQNLGVVISEFGARDRQNTSNRIDWATYYIESAKQFNIPCIWWDTGANPTPTTTTFCIFDRNTLTWQFAWLGV